MTTINLPNLGVSARRHPILMELSASTGIDACVGWTDARAEEGRMFVATRNRAISCHHERCGDLAGFGMEHAYRPPHRPPRLQPSTFP